MVVNGNILVNFASHEVDSAIIFRLFKFFAFFYFAIFLHGFFLKKFVYFVKILESCEVQSISKETKCY